MVKDAKKHQHSHKTEQEDAMANAGDSSEANDATADSDENQKAKPSARRKTVIPFVLFLIACVTAMALAKPCKVSQKLKRDCGYPGISYGDCVAVGKWRQEGALADLGMVWGGCFGIAMVCWLVSGYEAESIGFYLILSAAVAQRFMGCCWNAQVKGGVPHCYCSSGHGGLGLKTFTAFLR
mmetsp:Transcript_117045/g.331262  ORF Transcript_117045/g.331262 Transcript_117045/m.331262 type:complete len:181 (+) Transcript_117045:79-621(+)